MKNKKIWNKCLALALSTAMICSSGSVAFASEFTSGDDIATEQTTPENEDGGVSTEKVVPQTEEPAAEFDAPEEIEEFDAGTPEVEAFSAEDGVAAMTDENANSLEVKEIKSANDLQNLFASSDSVSIKLANDIYGAQVNVPANKTLVIDLNGHTLTNATDKEAVAGGANHTIINNGTLTITDNSGSIGAIDNITHGKAPLYNAVGGTVTILKGYFIRSKEAGISADNSGDNSYYYIDNAGTMTIGDGNTTNEDIHVGSDGHFSSLVHNGWYDGNKNSSGSVATLTINTGSFTGGLNTIKNDDYGKLIINSGEFINATQYCVQNWNEAQINGGIFESTMRSAVWNGYNNETMDKGIIEINDGYFKAPSDKTVVYRDNLNSGSFKINGGTFSNSKICNDSKYTVVENSDGTYGIAKVAQVGVESYSTLADAIIGSQDGDTVTLLSDVNLGAESLNINKSITLDLNGKTLSGNGESVVNINESVTIVDSAAGGSIQNINAEEGKSVNLLTGTLYLENGTLGSKSYPARGLYVAPGTSFIMKGGNVLSSALAIDICGHQTSDTSIHISGGNIEGNTTGIQISGNETDGDPENKVPYTVNTIISDSAIVTGGSAGITLWGTGLELNIEGGKVSGKDYGISGNGTRKEGGSTINITGGEITSNEVGIYHPQIGDLTVGGDAKITAANGIQYCGAGTVEISGNAVITATAGAFSGPNKSDKEGDGTVNDGAALSLISRGDGYQDDSHKMKVTIDGGTFVSNNNAAVSVYRFGKVDSHWTVNPGSISNYLESLKITGGSFKGSATRGSLEIDSAIQGEVVVSDGYFAQYPDTKYIASGMVVTTTDEKEGYSYKVEEKSEDSTVNGITTGETKATVPDEVNLGEKENVIKSAAGSIEAPGIVAATTKELEKGIEQEVSDKFEKIKQEQSSSTQSEVKLYAESFLDVTIKNYEENVSENIKSLQLDITPKIKYIASTKNTAEEAKQDNNAKEVVIKDLKSTVENLVMSIELPAEFATKDGNDWKPIYVEHIKNGTVYRYTATVTGDNTKQIATFINPHGFSLFKFTTSAPAVSIGEKSYATIEEAIADANGSATASTIKLLGDVTKESSDPAISISDGKNITLDLDGHTLTGNITNEGSLTITDSKGTGKIEGTVTNKKTTTISSGSVKNVATVSGTVSVNGGEITETLATSAGATTNVSNGTVKDIKSLGTTNIYGGNINGTITKTEGNTTGTINAYGGTYTDNNKKDVTPASGYYFDGNTIKSIPAPSLSSNNYLSGLTISQGTLTPAFDRNTTAYTAEVENATDSITVTPVKDSNWASLKVNDKTVASGSASEAIKLAEGANTITIRVTAENGSTKDYTITVTRKAAPGEEYTKLQKAVADYETYKKDGYTESSWTAFEKALKEAQEALKDTSLSEEKAKEILANLTKAAGELQLVGIPVIESVKVSGNKATVKLTGEAENAEGYDYVIGKKDCITTGNYADVRKNKGTATKFSYVQKGTYYAYCHAWKKVNGKKVFSAWSAPYKFTVKVTTVSAPKILSVKVNGRTVTVTLKNGKGIAGVDTVLGKTTVKDQYGKYPSEYELVSKNKTTTTIIFKNVPKGTYYVGAHAFKRYGSSKSKVFGKWSNIKKVVVK